MKRAAKLSCLKGVSALSSVTPCVAPRMLPNLFLLRRFATTCITLARAAHVTAVPSVQREEHCVHAADLRSDL